MSNFPPPLPYQSVPQATRSNMALTSMILGIIAIPTGIVGIGVLLGLVAIILGIISLVAISNRPDSLGGKGFAITGIITGAVGTLLVVPLVYFAFFMQHKSDELNKRTACGANIHGVLVAMVTYANEYNDCYPTPPAGTSSPTYAPLSYDPRTSSGNNNSLSPFGILIAQGSVGPKSLMCKSDPFLLSTPGTTSTSGLATIVNLAQNQNSYSIVVPWTSPTLRPDTGGWWKNNIDSSLPIMGDMVLAGPQPAGKSGFNSMNHDGEGQNIGFADAHIEWTHDVTHLSPAMTDLHATSPNPIPNTAPYAVWMTPHKTTSGALSIP